MNSRDVDTRSEAARHRAHERDQPPTEGDSYARSSFTWRRMESWRIWAIAIFAALIVILGLMWVW